MIPLIISHKDINGKLNPMTRKFFTDLEYLERKFNNRNMYSIREF